MNELDYTKSLIAESIRKRGNAEYEDCTRCKGKGVIIIGESNEPVTCPECNGYGLFLDYGTTDEDEESTAL